MYYLLGQILSSTNDEPTFHPDSEVKFLSKDTLCGGEGMALGCAPENMQQMLFSPSGSCTSSTLQLRNALFSNQSFGAFPVVMYPPEYPKGT